MSEGISCIMSILMRRWLDCGMTFKNHELKLSPPIVCSDRMNSSISMKIYISILIYINMEIKKFKQFESGSYQPSEKLSFDEMMDKRYSQTTITLSPDEIRDILNSLHSNMWRLKMRGDKRWSERKQLLNSILMKLNS